VDGIRSQNLTEEQAQDWFALMRRTAQESDACICPTAELAARLRDLGSPTYVLPNGFDDETFVRSRLAARLRRASLHDGLCRIGYATGSLTHQRDFAVVADALANELRANSGVCLVLYRHALDLDEFPAFDDLRSQVEWRDVVALEDLPFELSRFDVNLAPVEVGNPFCEAKSALKFFEAALVDVPTIASPTEPFRSVIVDGVNGFLAGDMTSWQRHLSELVSDSELRRSIAREARLSVTWDFGPERRLQMAKGIFDHFSPGFYLVAAATGVEHSYAYVGPDLQDTYGIDASSFGKATSLRDSYFLHSTAQQVLDRLRATPDGIAVSKETITDFSLNNGDLLRLRVLDQRTGRFHVVPFHVAGIVQEFPSAPKDSFMVTNLAYLESVTHAGGPNVVFAKASGSPPDVARRVAAATSSLGTKVENINAQSARTSSSITTVDLTGISHIEQAFAIVLAAAAMALFVALGISERRQEFATMAAIGAPLSRISAFLWTEAAIVLAVGLFLSYTQPPFVLYGTLSIIFLAYLTKELPVGYQQIGASLKTVHPELEDASRIFGATRLRALFDITAPLIRNGVIATWIFIFIGSIRELSATILLFTARTKTISVTMFDLRESNDWGPIAVLSITMLLITFAMILLINHFTDRRST